MYNKYSIYIYVYGMVTARNFEAHGTSKGTELRKSLRSLYVSYYT